MRTALIVLLSAGWLMGGALAQTGTGLPAPKAPDTSLKAPADAPAPKKKAAGTDDTRLGSQKDKAGATDALTTCLAMWEPATHMTRREWARACRRVADRLNNIVVK